MKLLKVGAVSVDGTTLKANANKNRGIRYDRAGELIEQLDMEVRELLEQAERTDRNELVPAIKAIPEHIGQPKTALADNGYLNEDAVRTLEARDDGDGHNDDEPRMNVLISAHAEAKQLQRKHDFRPCPADPQKAPQIRSAFVLEMKEKMERAESRAKYRLRKQTVEPVFGTIKKWMGFTQFLLRGHENVSGEWQLVTLAYNMKRLWRMQSAQNQGI